MIEKTILFDIDGTLANIAHRRIYLDEDEPNWKKFNSMMEEDIPNTPVVNLYLSLWNSNEYEIELVTGRSEEFREITQQWLVWNEIPFSKIHMRPKMDNRADHKIKKEVLDKLLKQGKQIEFVVDDRQQVVDMWRANGITCLQCDVGDF